MRRLFTLAIFIIALQNTSAYSKYGRSCKDIGCSSNEVCVMEEEPCSYYNRDQCGKYPTCKPSGDDHGPSCARFVCPPTMICHIDNGTPKCVAKSSSSSRVIPVHADSDRPNIHQVPDYPNQPAPGGLYPSITTPRPRYPALNGGYSGGQPGSGYPGYSGGQPGSGYPGYSGGQPGQGYPGYQNRGGYPYNSNQGYPGYPNQGGYPQGQYPGYNSGHNNRGSHSSSNSGSNPLVDKLTSQLKTIGTSILKNALGRLVQ